MEEEAEKRRLRAEELKAARKVSAPKPLVKTKTQKLKPLMVKAFLEPETTLACLDADGGEVHRGSGQPRRVDVIASLGRAIG